MPGSSSDSPRGARVLSLFDATGRWGDAYREQGSLVTCVDVTRGEEEDVRFLEVPAAPADVILASPPCTHLASSGARWWKRKGPEALAEALALVDATLRIILVQKPSVWAIENPRGRLSRYIGRPRFTFHPAEFAGWADDPDAEAYTKSTCLWGEFKIPERRPVPPVLGSLMHRAPDSRGRDHRRSVTPQGFARAFAAANPGK